MTTILRYPLEPEVADAYPHLKFEAFTYGMPKPDGSSGNESSTQEKEGVMLKVGAKLVEIRTYIPPSAMKNAVSSDWQLEDAMLVGSKTLDQLTSFKGIVDLAEGFVQSIDLSGMAQTLVNNNKYIKLGAGFMNTISSSMGKTQMPSKIPIFKGTQLHNPQFQFDFDPYSLNEAKEVNTIVKMFEALAKPIMNKMTLAKLGAAFGTSGPMGALIKKATSYLTRGIIFLDFPPLWKITVMDGSSSDPVTNFMYDKSDYYAITTVDSTAGEGAEYNYFHGKAKYPVKTNLSVTFQSMYPPRHKDKQPSKADSWPGGAKERWPQIVKHIATLYEGGNTTETMTNKGIASVTRRLPRSTSQYRSRGANTSTPTAGTNTSSGANQGGANQGGANQGGANQGGANQPNANQPNANQPNANQPNTGAGATAQQGDGTTQEQNQQPNPDNNPVVDQANANAANTAKGRTTSYSSSSGSSDEEMSAEEAKAKAKEAALEEAWRNQTGM